MTDEQKLLWKVALGLCRLEGDPSNSLVDRFCIGDEDVTHLWQEKLIFFDWDGDRTVKLTVLGRAHL